MAEIITPHINKLMNRLVLIGHVDRIGDAYRLTKKGLSYLNEHFFKGDPHKLVKAERASSFKELGEIIYGNDRAEAFTSIVDCLPQSGHRVLVLIDNGTVQEAWFVKRYGRLIKGESTHQHGIWKSDQPIVGNVRGWMPLPIPPASEGER